MRNVKRLKSMFPAVLAFACALVTPAFAEDAVSVSVANDETPALWFIELAGPPISDGGKKADLKKGRDAFAAAAKVAGASYTKRFEFETLWNGVSIQVSPADLSRITRLPEVVNVWPVETYSIPSPGGDNSPELAYALPMTGTTVAQAAGFTGAGIKIGIIDTGIDIDHPDFGGTGTPGTTPFPNAKVIAGYDFVGDAYNADPSSASYNPVPSPDPNPDDCGGHGSHVAGIAAANGLVKGVAPDARLGAYRVFGCNGSTNSDIMIAAMERAYLDGMNVVNMSIGAAFQTWPQYPTAAAGDRLVARGVVVVCSIGNSGTSGQFSASAPGVGRDIIGTASFDNARVTLPVFTVNSTSIAYQTMTFSPPAPLSGTVAIVNVGRGCVAGTGVPAGGDPYLADPSGKVALIERGVCSFGEKASRAIAAGAVGVVVYNSAGNAGVVAGTLGASLGSDVPVVGISRTDGLFIAAQAAPVMMNWTDLTLSSPSSTGGLVSSFSSYGFTAELDIKPDLGAPGGNIWSTIPIEQGSYGNNSGTSMASPHMAGMVALLKQAKPWLSAKAIRDVMQNNAVPANWSGAPSLGYLDFVHRQGAGLGRIDRAIAATTTITPGKLSLGETEAGPVTKTLTFSNSGNSPVTYGLSHTQALATASSNDPGFGVYLGPSTVGFSSATVVVPAHGSATVDVTIDANPGLPANAYFGGYVVATPQGDGEVLRVPFGGTKGDYQAIKVIAPTPYGFPWLAQRVGTSYFNRPAGATYTMVGNDFPFILIRLGHQSRELKLDLYEAATGAPVHPVFHTAFKEEYLPRNGLASDGTPTSFFAFVWDGTREHNNGKGNDYVKVVPNGDYVMKLSILKALGDPNNPDHWETWTSPVVTVARP